jgi:hypothetical protein
MTDFSYGLNRGDKDQPQSVKTATVTPAAAVALAATADTDAGTADTAAGTVVTDLTTVDTDVDTFAAAVIAITGDTYNTTTDQFTFGGATGLTHAQWATVGALLNTALAAFITAQTAATTAKTDTAATKVATAAVVAALGGALADITLYIQGGKGVTKLDALKAIEVFEQFIGGNGVGTTTGAGVDLPPS